MLTKIKEARRGSLIFPADFICVGSEAAVRKALSRLAQEGVLVRLAHGIYLYPKLDKELGVLYPPAEEIAQAIAKREGVRIVPTGVYALNRLGLSTQVPTRIVYLTDGEDKRVKVGKTSIVFKPTVPKKLSAKGKLSGLAIQALAELKKDKVTPSVLERLREVLQSENPDLIRADAQAAPAWIARLLISLTSNIAKDDTMAAARK